MNITINRERLAQTFVTLCELSSPSRKEKNVALYLKDIFSSLGADFIYEDDSAVHTGSECGNLIVRINGTTDSDPVFFACHMDTVQPGDNVFVKRDGDIFTSKENKRLTLSAGVAIAHYKTPLSIAIEKAREMEKAAKAYGTYPDGTASDAELSRF